MKWPNYGGRAFESMGALFMVTPIDEFEPELGDLVELFDEGSTWFIVLEKFEDEGVEWFSIRRATWWERLFGGRREQDQVQQ